MEEQLQSVPTAPILGAEEMFRAYADMVYRLAFLRTKSSQDADDILQEVFLRCLRARPAFTSAEHQKAWLLRVTINCSKTLLTSAWRRHQAKECDEILTEMTDNTDVYAAVIALPEKYRTVVHLFYYEGYRVEEIASLLDSKPSTVKSWLFRAREMLREQLKEDYSDV